MNWNEIDVILLRGQLKDIWFSIDIGLFYKNEPKITRTIIASV